MASNVPAELEDKFKRCKEKVMADGSDEASAYGICYSAVVEGKADALEQAAKSGFVLTDKERSEIIAHWTSKFSLKWMAVKVAGDWELDVTAAPFNKPDSDEQTFDEGTDFMLEVFTNPVIIYHHGIEPGKKAIQNKPTIIGKSVGIRKEADGIHIRVLLDKSIEWARRVWEAAKKGLAVASSDSISHLARLQVGNKTMMYDKGRAGRISVWPLAGVSLWDRVETNFQPASQYAIALPSMKAIYREAGVPFPVVLNDTQGDLSEAQNAAKRARVKEAQERSKKLLKAYKA